VYLSTVLMEIGTYWSYEPGDLILIPPFLLFVNTPQLWGGVLFTVHLEIHFIYLSDIHKQPSPSSTFNMEWYITFRMCALHACPFHFSVTYWAGH